MAGNRLTRPVPNMRTHSISADYTTCVH